MGKVNNYLSLIKFSHTIFAMPFALIGFFLGIVPVWGLYFDQSVEWFMFHSAPNMDLSGSYPADLRSLIIRFLLVIGCMIFARSAAMAFNRYLDRKFDEKNPRTAVREIPSGVITAKNALIFTVVSSVLFILTCFFINRLCFYLSPVALLVVLGYSYTKRFTPLCHLILGLGLSLAPIGAYLAVTGHFNFLPILFSLVVLFWVSGFDIIYALQDVEFDRANQLYSIPAWLGKARGLRVSEILHIICGALVIEAGIYGNFGWLYVAGATVFLGMLIYQHTIVKPNDLKRVNLAFMTANGIASVVFAIFVIIDILISNS